MKTVKYNEVRKFEQFFANLIIVLIYIYFKCDSGFKHLKYSNDVLFNCEISVELSGDVLVNCQ